MRSLRLPASSLPVFVTYGTAVSALAFAMCIPSIARAEEPPGSSWGLGIAGISTQKAYTGMSRDNIGFPLVFYENSWVRVFGPVVELKLPSLDLSATQKIDFHLVGKYDGSGYKPDDAPILSGMEERKGSFYMGGKVTWRNDVVDVSAEVLADATGNSKGKRATLGLEKNWRLGEHVMLAPRLSASWNSKEYVDYYYGVRASEALASRPVYLGKAGVNAEVGARATYLFNASHSVILDVSATSLPKEIKNSPLVDRSTENRVSLGYMYRF